MQHNRRAFLNNCGIGFGGLALASMLADEATGDLRKPHFAPKAKQVIYLHMIGAPSHLDLYDEKPELVKHHNEPCPAEITKDRDFAFIGKTSTLDIEALNANDNVKTKKSETGCTLFRTATSWKSPPSI